MRHNESPKSQGDPGDLPFPKLSSEPLSVEEVSACIQEMNENFDALAQALQTLETTGSEFLNTAAGLVSDPIRREDFDTVLPFLAQARFILVPPGCREPDLDFDRVCDAFEQQLDELGDVAEGADSDELMRFFQKSRQPAMMQVLMAYYFEAATELPEKRQPPIHVQVILAMVMKVMIDELDRALRG